MEINRFTIGKPVLICAFILLFFAVEGIGATYYVAPNGSDSNPGIKTSPFRNIQKAADVVAPGDTIIVKDGHYYDHNSDNWVLRINRGGTPGNPIILRAENKHQAIIDGENNTTGYGVDVNAPYVIVDGLDVSGMSSHGMWIREEGRYAIIRNCYFHDIARLDVGDSSSGHVGIYTTSGSYSATIDRNKFETIGRTNTGCNHCYRHDHGLYLRGKWHTITNNTFYDFPAGWAISARGYTGDPAAGKPNHIISNNTFADSTNTNVTGQINIFVNSGDDINPEVILIQNNVFGKVVGDAIVRVTHDFGDLYFYNNVAAEPNIVSSSGKSYKLYSSGNSMGRSTKDFAVKDWDNRDFRLTVNSSLMIDKGRARYAPDHDHFNAPRTNLIDIGAYELDDSSQSAEVPTPPQGLKVIQ